jgi:hypothetical protein
MKNPRVARSVRPPAVPAELVDGLRVPVVGRGAEYSNVVLFSAAVEAFVFHPDG